MTQCQWDDDFSSWKKISSTNYSHHTQQLVEFDLDCNVVFTMSSTKYYIILQKHFIQQTFLFVFLDSVSCICLTRENLALQTIYVNMSIEQKIYLH